MAGPLDAGCRLLVRVKASSMVAAFPLPPRSQMAARTSSTVRGAELFRRPFMGGIGAVQGLSIIEDGFIEEFRFGAGCAFPVDSIIGMKAAAKAAEDGKNRDEKQRTSKRAFDAALRRNALSFLQPMPKMDDKGR